MLERLGRVNERASIAVPTFVSRECVATLVQRDEQGWFFTMGYAEDEDFIPPFARHQILPHWRRKKGSAIRLTRVMSNQNADAIVVGVVWSGFEEEEGSAEEA